MGTQTSGAYKDVTGICDMYVYMYIYIYIYIYMVYALIKLNATNPTQK